MVSWIAPPGSARLWGGVDDFMEPKVVVYQEDCCGVSLAVQRGACQCSCLQGRKRIHTCCGCMLPLRLMSDMVYKRWMKFDAR